MGGQPMATLLKYRIWYYCQFYDPTRSPKQKRTPLKTKSRETAQKLHRQLEDEYATGEYDPWTGYRKKQQVVGLAKHSTIQQALDVYIEFKSREDWRETTRQTISYVLKDFARYAGLTSSVQTLTPVLINDYLNQDRFAYETKKTHKTKIKPFVLWLVRKEILIYDFSEMKVYNKDQEQSETVSYITAE
jgi:hypothetical protein